jgi:hypothetical protein
LIGASSENNLDINIEIVDIEDKIEFVSIKPGINAHIAKYVVLIWQENNKIPHYLLYKFR